MKRYLNLFIALIAIQGDLYAAEAGMPQLDPKYWASQAFWLIIVFTVLYFSISKFYLPKIKNNLDDRENRIKDDIEDANKSKELSESKLKEYDEIVLKSKMEALNIFRASREKLLKDINAKKEILDKQIDEEIKKAEKEIDVLKKGAPEKINKIAIEASSELVKKLIGAEVNNSSISAIVEDLLKKNGNKYYGN